MTGFLIVAAIWLAVAIPGAVVVGRALRGLGEAQSRPRLHLVRP